MGLVESDGTVLVVLRSDLASGVQRLQCLSHAVRHGYFTSTCTIETA